MSDSDRSKDDRPWWVIPGVVAIASVVAFVVFWTVWSSYSNWNQNQENAEQIEAYSNRYTVERCNRINPVDASKCISEAAQAAQDQQRTEADLYAQRQMAVWTILVAVCAAISIPLSLAGIFFVWQSLALNREAVRAALAANETARKIGMAETKAYLVSEGGRFSVEDDLLQIEIHLKNVGRSPAIKVSIEGKAFIPSIVDERGIAVSEQFNTDEGAGQCNSIQVDSTETGWIRLNIEGIHPTQKASIGNGARFTYALQVYWKDVFGFWDGLTYVGDGFSVSLLGTSGAITHSNVIVAPNISKLNEQQAQRR